MNLTTGSIAWFDFPTTDETKSIPFFKNVLNWNLIPMGPDYWMIKVDENFIGGLRKEVNFKVGNACTLYVTVPSIKEGKALVEKNGGKLDGESIAISGGDDGYFQNFFDLDGNLFALWSKKA